MWPPKAVDTVYSRLRKGMELLAEEGNKLVNSTGAEPSGFKEQFKRVMFDVKDV